MNLKYLGAQAHKINAANGWDVFNTSHWPYPGCEDEAGKVRFLGTHMTLVHEEVSEAFRAVRNRNRENFNEELADVIIRVSSIAHGLGIDLEKEIVAKLAINSKRGFRHGGKAV